MNYRDDVVARPSTRSTVVAQPYENWRDPVHKDNCQPNPVHSRNDANSWQGIATSNNTQSKIKAHFHVLNPWIYGCLTQGAQQIHNKPTDAVHNEMKTGSGTGSASNDDNQSRLAQQQTQQQCCKSKATWLGSKLLCNPVHKRIKFTRKPRQITRQEKLRSSLSKGMTEWLMTVKRTKDDVMSVHMI